MTPPSYSIVFSEVTLKKIRDYQAAVASGQAAPGKRLALHLANAPAPDLRTFIDCLINTKLPRIYAESEVAGDGSDWNATELSILGDINIATPVKIFDNGVWDYTDDDFAQHPVPLDGYLLFTPGALLQSNVPDLAEVTTDGKIDQKKYNQLVERRLLPLLAYANAQGKDAVITLPGIGCGAFAGNFKGSVARHLDIALQSMLAQHAAQLPHIKGVYFDPRSEGTALQKDIGHMRYISAPNGLPQLSSPDDLGFRGHTLFKIVAWDHVSWPGNDFFAGHRFTDDGMVGAATDSMLRITGIEGRYLNGFYLPPSGVRTWQSLTSGKKLSTENIYITPTGAATCAPLDDKRASHKHRPPRSP